MPFRYGAMFPVSAWTQTDVVIQSIPQDPSQPQPRQPLLHMCPVSTASRDGGYADRAGLTEPYPYGAEQQHSASYILMASTAESSVTDGTDGLARLMGSNFHPSCRRLGPDEHLRLFARIQGA